MAELVLSDVHAHYGQSHILHGASMTVNTGSIVTLLGRNGMGKSTLLRSIMGLTPASAGTIVYNDIEIQGMKPYDIYSLGIGYVPQGRRMFKHLTVLENLRMGLRNKNQKHPAVFDKIFSMFPILYERSKQKAGTLSGGEQQMLAIARALAGEVGLLLLDEPTEGIQPSVVDEILMLLERVNSDDGLTILLVEQNMELALSVASIYFVMEKGAVVESGSAADINRDDVIQKYLVV